MKSRPGKVRLKTTPAELRAAGVLLELPRAGVRLDLAALFGNARPVEIEVGPGKGAFLLRRAAERPETNLLGVEWIRSYAAYAADRAYRAGAANIRVLCADAGEVFRSHLPARSAWRVHIYFPDPWPKRRHRRRRLIGAAFMRDACRALRIGGWLGVVTDDAEYFRQIRQALWATGGLAEVSFAPERSGALAGSNFANKYAACGKDFQAVAAIRYR